VLQPVFPGFSVLSPSWLCIEVPVMLAIVAVFSWLLSGRRMLRVRRVPAWKSATTGVAGDSSYTAFGYASPTRRVLASVLHTRAPVTRPHVEYESDVVETYLYPPARRLFLTMVSRRSRIAGLRQFLAAAVTEGALESRSPAAKERNSGFPSPPAPIPTPATVGAVISREANAGQLDRPHSTRATRAVP
jgi:hypothetical protein